MKTNAEDFVECIAQNCSAVRFCVNCGLVDHVASQCVENPVGGYFAYSRCAEVEVVGAASHTVALEDDRVLMLHTAEPQAFYTSLTISCAKQVKLACCRQPLTLRGARLYQSI